MSIISLTTDSHNNYTSHNYPMIEIGRLLPLKEILEFNAESAIFLCNDKIIEAIKSIISRYFMIQPGYHQF